MNLAFIRYFLAVADTGSFTRAAERLHVTQPTLSAGIRRLEEFMGAPLLERGRRAQLTAAGSRFLPRARLIVGELAEARVELNRPGQPVRLRLGVVPSLPGGPLVALVAALARALPGSEVELREERAPALLDRVARRRLHAAIVPLANLPEGLAGTMLFRDPFGLAIAAHHPLASRSKAQAAEVAHLPFLVRSACERHAEAEHAFAARGLRPRVALRSTNDDRVARLVAAGLGVAFMPRSLGGPGIAFVQLVELPVERRVGLVWRAGAAGEPLDTLQRLATSHRWQEEAMAVRETLDYAH